jgi:hypothetical protein
VKIETASLVLVQVMLFVGSGWVAGNYLLELALGRAERLPDNIGLPERTLAAIVGAVCFSIALMLAHIATGGRVFGNPWPVPLMSAALLITGLRRRMWPKSIPWSLVATAGAVLFLLYVLPVIVAGSGVRTGDPPWHLGWSNQLLSGETVPTGPAPEFSRNAYPWAFHAVLVTMVRLAPGSNPLIAHEALHVLLVAAVPLGVASLARLIDRRSAVAAAGAASLIGGFGWLLSVKPKFGLTPSTADFGADLVVASPNSVYELLPPAYPRELGIVILAGAGVLVAHAAMSSRRAPVAAAGIVIGVAGLVSLPLLVLGVLWLVGALVIGTRTRRRADLWAIGIAGAIGTASIWLIPLTLSYIRYGGFIDVTPVMGVEWPLPTALGSWGLLLPLAAAGLAVVLAKRGTGMGGRLVIVMTGGTIILLVLAIARGRLGWNLGNNATLLHQGRVWPAAHLLGAVFAGVAMVVLFDWLRRHSRRMAVSGVGVLLLVGVVSPVYASIHLTRVMMMNERGFIYSGDDFDRDRFVFRATAVLEANDVVRVHGPDLLGFLLFQFSGARLAAYDDPRMDGNDLRIRFVDLALGWEERMRDGGFTADFTVMTEADAPSGALVVARGDYGEESWVLVEGDP